MYLGELGQQCTPGERFRIIAQKGARRLSCPPGTSTESSGRLGTGQQYVWCYRPGVCAAPPPAPVTTISPTITTQVPTAVSTQVSPQISPTMAQQQASPGAGVTAAPTAAPGPVSAQPSTGITGEDLRRILEAQAAADEAERQARERKSAAEMETLRQEMATRERATQEIFLAEQKAAADRAAAERYATEQAEAEAAASAQAIPPPASTTYAPSGGGAFPMPQAMDLQAPITTEARDVSVTADAGDAGPPWALILLAAGGVAALAIMGGKGKRKSRAKK